MVTILGSAAVSNEEEATFIIVLCRAGHAVSGSYGFDRPLQSFAGWETLKNSKALKKYSDEKNHSLYFIFEWLFPPYFLVVLGDK